MNDPLIGKTLLIDGKPWTIASKFEGIDYFYLVNPDEEKPICRSTALLRAAIFQHGLEVEP